MSIINTTVGTDLLQNTTSNIQFLSTNWIIGLLLTFFILLLITRNVAKWGELALPVTLLLMIVGIHVSLLQIVGTGLIFVITLMNSNVLGNFLDSSATLASRKETRQITKMIKKQGKANVAKEIKRRQKLYSQLGTKPTWGKDRVKELKEQLRGNL